MKTFSGMTHKSTFQKKGGSLGLPLVLIRLESNLFP